MDDARKAMLRYTRYRGIPMPLIRIQKRDILTARMIDRSFMKYAGDQRHYVHAELMGVYYHQIPVLLMNYTHSHSHNEYDRLRGMDTNYRIMIICLGALIHQDLEPEYKQQARDKLTSMGYEIPEVFRRHN